MFKPTDFLRAVVALSMAGALAHGLTLTNESATYTSLTSETVTMTGHSELHLTGAADPIPGCTINLNSEDSWVFFHDTTVPPSYVQSTLLSRIKVNGASAVLNTNARIVAYGEGAVVIPQSSSFQPLTIYAGRNFSGASMKPVQYTRYNSAAQLGAFYGGVRSFTLKRGYMATFAQNTNGTGPSRNYVAQDSDLEIGVMPGEIDGNVRFIRVFPWRWTKKKGIAGNIGGQLDIGWWYDWNIDQNSSLDREYVAIRQTRWWPGLNQDWQARGVNHLLGYNEPDNTAEANMAVGDAIWSWPDLLWDGLRVGSPAPTDGGRAWLYDFMNQAATNNLRVDFVAVHYYWCYDPANPSGAASQMYGFLQQVHNTTGKPVWITEWNNGANWTGCGDPTYVQQAAAIQAMTQMLENTPWVERYAPYNWVEDVRRLQWDDGYPTQAGFAYRDIPSKIGHVQVVPDSGAAPVAKYFYSGDFRDDSGNGNNPLVYGTPTVAASGTARGSALVLDGTDDFLNLPPKVADAGDFTFAAWVKWDGGANWQRIMDCGAGTNNFMYLSPNSAGTNLRFAIKNGGTEQVLNAAMPTVGAWTHVAITLTGDTGRLYVNGSLATSGSITINPNQLGATNCFLGDSQFSADPLYDGMLDDVMFLNSALSAADIAVLASTTETTPPAAPSGLVSNAGNGQVALDWSDNTEVDFANYSVYRSTTNGSGYTLIASNLVQSDFLDTTVTNGATYYYVVTATDARGNQSAYSTQAVANPRSDLLIAHYMFEGDFQDSSGFGFHGTATGEPTFVSGPVNLGLKFDGVNDYVTLPAGVANGSDITISTWVYWGGGGQWQRIFDIGNNTTQNLFLTPRSGSNTLRFAITQSGGTGEQRLETTQLATNQWVHLAVVLQGNIGRLYVNGALATSATITVNPGDFNPANNLLGKSQYADPLFNGALDDFRIYSYALSADAIADLADYVAPADPTPPQSLAWWRFETGPDSANVAHSAAVGYPNYSPDIADSSGSGNELSMWQTGGGTGFSYDNDVPFASVAQTNASNNFSIQNTGGYPASFTEPAGPLTSVVLPAWTVEASYKPQTGGFRTVVGRNANQVAGPSSGLAALYIGATTSNELRVIYVDEDGHVHEAKSATGYVTGFDATTDPEGTTGTWYKIAAVSDGSTLSLYNNGALVASTDLTASGSANTALTEGYTTAGGTTVGGGDVGGWTVGYGMYGGNHTDRAYGLIDEVRITPAALKPDRFLLFDPDADNDGLKDTWELAYFRTLAPTASADPDGDGLTNLTEQANGTVPTISDLIPQLDIALSSGNVVVTWPTNHTGWRLEYSETLDSDWQTIPGSTKVHTYQMPIPTTAIPRGFFRLAYP